jgi:hypothetical protein
MTEMRCFADAQHHGTPHVTLSVSEESQGYVNTYYTVIRDASLPLGMATVRCLIDTPHDVTAFNSSLPNENEITRGLIAAEAARTGLGR